MRNIFRKINSSRLSTSLNGVILLAVILSFACRLVPPIYRSNPDLSKPSKSEPKTAAVPARKGAYFVTLGPTDRAGSRSATGMYEQCESNGIRARIIRQVNGTRAVYAYGWDAREAEVFKGKQVQVTGKMTWRPSELKAESMGTRKILPLPHFVTVKSINRIATYADPGFGKFNGACH